MSRMNIKKLVILVISLMMTVIPLSAVATSWAQLTPEELIERAEIIAAGRYIIDDAERFDGQGMWVPFTFEVDQYYRGDGTSRIEAAIEQYDVGWAKEFQDQGGRFLIFLYKEEGQLWLPVGGPNGMVQLKDGKIESLSETGRVTLAEFLSKQEPIIPQVTESEAAGEESQVFKWLAGGALLVVILLLTKWGFSRRAK